jgi:hypothetical protein
MWLSDWGDNNNMYLLFETFPWLFGDLRQAAGELPWLFSVDVDAA